MWTATIPEELEAVNTQVDVCAKKYDMLYCTRKRGHSGNHVAAGLEDHICGVWTDTTELELTKP
jgi:hypothetical protein